MKAGREAARPEARPRIADRVYVKPGSAAAREQGESGYGPAATTACGPARSEETDGLVVHSQPVDAHRAVRQTAMKTSILVVLLTCISFSSGYAQEVADSDVTAKIVAMEQVWNQAYVLKDSKALAKILDDRFVNLESDGRLITKGDMLAEVKGSTTLQIFTESTEVHVHGDTAIATGIFRIKGVQRGKPFAQRARFVDTWLC